MQFKFKCQFFILINVPNVNFPILKPSYIHSRNGSFTPALRPSTCFFKYAQVQGRQGLSERLSERLSKRMNEKLCADMRYST